MLMATGENLASRNNVINPAGERRPRRSHSHAQHGNTPGVATAHHGDTPRYGDMPSTVTFPFPGRRATGRRGFRACAA